ncbi:MAG: glycerophosphodiester phosphodiesterase family protein [Salinimicrobium sp.]
MEKIKNILILCLTCTVMYSCGEKIDRAENTSEAEQKLEVQGHRGDRGSYPENTLPSFYSAVEKGVDVLELDVVISKDRKVVVSHEPFMFSRYMLDYNGDTIAKAEERNYNFFEMTYDSIRKFDAGSKGNKLFPQQQKMKSYKPLLSEMIDSVEKFIRKNNLDRIRYNIELKSGKNLYGNYQPYPEEFVNLVMDVVKAKNIETHSNIQSFDVRVLNYLHRAYPQMKTGYLVSTTGIQKNLDKLNFKPDSYNPYFGLVKSKEFVDSIKGMDMTLIPWTVNKHEDIQRMIDLKVDGLITDYPERAIEKL